MLYKNVNDYVMSKLVELWRNQLRFSIISDENLFKTHHEFRSIIDEAERIFGGSKEIDELKSDIFKITINDSIKISYNNIWKNGDPMIKKLNINTNKVKSEFDKAKEYLDKISTQIIEETPYSGKIDSSLTKTYVALQDAFRYIEENFNLNNDELDFLKSRTIRFGNDVTVNCDGIYKNGKRILYDYKFNDLNDVTENVTKCLDLQEEFNKGADKILQDKPNIINQDWLYKVYLNLRVLLKDLKETCLYNNKILKEVESYSYLVVGNDGTKYYIRYDNVYKQELVELFEKGE